MNTPYGQQDTWWDCSGISGWMITRCWLPGQEKGPIADNGSPSPAPISPTPVLPGSPPSTDDTMPGPAKRTIWDKERRRLGAPDPLSWIIPVGLGVILIGVAVGIGTAKKRKRGRT